MYCLKPAWPEKDTHPAVPETRPNSARQIIKADNLVFLGYTHFICSKKRVQQKYLITVKELDYRTRKPAPTAAQNRPIQSNKSKYAVLRERMSVRLPELRTCRSMSLLCCCLDVASSCCEGTTTWPLSSMSVNG